MKFYIAATRQNDGKTLACLGITAALKKRFQNVGYIKPVGQRFIEIDGHKIDEDALLFKNVYNLSCDLQNMSPVAVPHGFTEAYIDNPDRESISNSITKSFEAIDNASDVVVVEGTGHAGVGSVFDMSNADVAKLLGCKVVLVASGGIGRPIDEIMLNKSMFDAAGVEVLGAIINKVEDAKYDKITDYVKRGLARKGIELLGVIPYRDMLSNPTVEQLIEDINGTLLSGDMGMQNIVNRMIIGAMPPHQAIDYLKPDCLLITPGTRDDLILAALSSCIMQESGQPSVAGIILTGGTPPQPNIMELVNKTHLPMILVQEDTFKVASKIAKLIVKIRPSDVEKIKVAEELIEKHVCIDRILEKVTL